MNRAEVMKKFFTVLGTIGIIGIIAFELFNVAIFIYIFLLIGIPFVLFLLIDIADRLGGFPPYERKNKDASH